MSNVTKPTCLLAFDLSNPWSVEFYLGLFVPLLCFVGAIGNFANIVVLSDKRFENHTYTYLTFLAIVQLVTLISQGVYMIFLSLINYQDWIGFAAVNFIWPIFSLGTTLSLVTTVVYTIERWIFIRNMMPNPHNKKEQQRRARIVCAIVAACVLLLNFPRMIAMDYVSGCVAQRWHNKWFSDYTIGRFVIYNLGSLATLLVFNFILVAFVLRHRKRFRQLLARNKPMQNTALLMTVSTPASEFCSSNQISVTSANHHLLSPQRQTFDRFTTVRECSRAQQQKSVTLTVIAATFLVLICELYVVMFNPISEQYTWGRLNLPATAKHYMRNVVFAVLAVEYGGNIVLYYILNRNFREILCKRFNFLDNLHRSHDENVSTSTKSINNL